MYTSNALVLSHKEVWGRFSRCNESGEVLTRPQPRHSCPTRQRELKRCRLHTEGSGDQGRKKHKGGRRFHHCFSDLCLYRGQELIFQHVKKAVGFELSCWMTGRATASHVILIRKPILLACQKADVIHGYPKIRLHLCSTAHVYLQWVIAAFASHGMSLWP